MKTIKETKKHNQDLSKVIEELEVKLSESTKREEIAQRIINEKRKYVDKLSEELSVLSNIADEELSKLGQISRRPQISDNIISLISALKDKNNIIKEHIKHHNSLPFYKRISKIYL